MRFFAVIGIITVLFVVAVVALIVVYKVAVEGVPSRTILEVDLRSGVVEKKPRSRLARLTMPDVTSLRSVVEGIYRAAEDKRVRGLVVMLDGSAPGIGKVQEIRNAVAAFRESGKPSVAFALSMGEMRSATQSYYLASACERVYVQPSASVGLTGLVSSSPFLNNALDKLGVEPSLAHRKQYKTAKYMLTETKFIPPHEEMVRALLGSLHKQIVAGIAQARSLSIDTVRTLIDRGPFMVSQAVEAELISAARYRDQVYEELKEKAGGKAKPYPLDSYLKQAGGPYRKGKTLALIYGVGTIHAGKSGYDPFGGLLMGAQSLTRAFRQAAADPKVKAIVFRINSPGGSYVASDAIWRAVVQAREAGKPVIVSMSDVAASGGYFVAAPATIIVAHPGTLTGSIGVVGGKVVTEEFWSKLGVSWDEIHTNENATIGLPTEEFTPDQWERLQNRLDSIYMDFKRKVAQGRSMSMEHVEESAKGRVWTGADASKLGLVDTLGGLPEAIRLAKDAAGIAVDQPVQLQVFPKRKPLLARLLSGMSSESPEENMHLGPHTLKRLKQLRRIGLEAGIGYPRGELHMQDIEPAP